MQNPNGTFKEKGLSVGSQVRCFKLTSGNKADGSMWGLINHVEKDQNKNVVQKYSLWLNNDSQFIANFPSDKTVDVKIEKINSIKPEYKTYTNKNGQKVNERIINLTVVISIVQVIDNSYNNTNNYMNNNNYNNNYNNDYMNNGNNAQPQYNQPQYNQSQVPINQQDTFDTEYYKQQRQKPVESNANEVFGDFNIDESDLPF